MESAQGCRGTSKKSGEHRTNPAHPVSIFTKANVAPVPERRPHFPTNDSHLEPTSRHKRILVAPLNWGLGHVARCVPLIQTLESLGAEVLLASDGAALLLLRAEFPHLRAFNLPSYGIRYDTYNMVWNITRQLPRIVWAVRAEQAETERLVAEHGINGIISDNRYGCFSRQAHSVMLTHQMRPRIPSFLLDWPAQMVLRRALGKFDAVWVPDAHGEPNLSGQLSHGEPAHPNTRFTGILTRMKNYPREREYDVAVVLSGPEPQRSILENRLMEQAMSLPQDFIFIQGKTQSKQHYRVGENIEVVSYLTSKDLNDVLMASRVVVCRSGYSSIMDLAVLGKKAILIPTPGQTEQEYLAEALAAQGLFLTQHQDKINLEEGIRSLGNTRGLTPGLFPTDAHKTLLEKWLGEI